MKHAPRNGTVLLFYRPKYQADRDKINGVYAAAIRRNWQVLTIDALVDARTLCAQTKIWNPLGCIVCDESLKNRLEKSELNGLPVVLIGRDTFRRRHVFDQSSLDLSAASECAARVLTERGLASYAYVGLERDKLWDKIRGRRFRTLVARHGVFSEYVGKPLDTPSGQHALTAWLKDLPKPCGVFLATDHLAPLFYSAAARAKLAIPGDLVVIGTDNVEQICLSAKPNLSSIAIDYTRAGENAVRLLEERLSRPTAPAKTMTYGALGPVIRGSTEKGLGSPRVERAVEFIRAHACEPISSKDVLALMGCSRRLGENLFRERTGQTILAAIQDERLNAAFRLLRARTMPIDEIPYVCGYDSLAYFKNLFRRRTGLSMRAWQALNATGA